MTITDDGPKLITLVNPATGMRFQYRGRWLRNSPATDRDIKPAGPGSAATRCT